MIELLIGLGIGWLLFSDTRSSSVRDFINAQKDSSKAIAKTMTFIIPFVVFVAIIRTVTDMRFWFNRRD